MCQNQRSLTVYFELNHLIARTSQPEILKMLKILNSHYCFHYCSTFILKETSFGITEYRNLADRIFPIADCFLGPLNGRISKFQLSVKSWKFTGLIRNHTLCSKN